MALETNLNQSPYFDDFDETKNYNRILFRPGFAVQARELTQLQTILQNQIERFGNEILVDGTIVTGTALKIEDIDFVKLRDKDANNRVILLTDFFSSGAVANATITGETSGMTAQLIDVADGSEGAAPDHMTLFVKYTNSGTNNSTKSFADNETIVLRTRTGSSFIVAANTITSSSTGLGTRASVSDGVIFHKGHFVRVGAQSHIVDKYSTSPSKKVGFQTVETLVNSNVDSSLTDNASGSTNFAAPGADRLKLLPTLASRVTGAANTATFFTIAELKDGVLIRNNKETMYSDIGKHIAMKFHETLGNYATEPFTIRIREHLKSSENLGRYNSDQGGNANKLIAEVDKGIGYVNGQKVHLINPTPLEIDKATDFITRDARVLTQTFGNYVIVNNVVGTWDFQGLREVNLQNVAGTAIASRTFGNTTIPGGNSATIGTAKVRGFAYHSGTAGTASGQFKLYLFDIRMNTDKNFADVRSIFEQNSDHSSVADIVLTNGNAVIQEPSNNLLVLPFSALGTKTLKDSSNNVDTQFVFRTEKTVSINPSATSTVAANSAHAGGVETLNETGSPLSADNEKKVIVVLRTPEVTTDPRKGHITSFGTKTITGAGFSTGNKFSDYYQVGDIIRLTDTKTAPFSGSSTTEDHVIASIATNGESLTTVDNISASRSGLGTSDEVSHRQVFPKGYIFDTSANGTISSDSTSHSITLQQSNTSAQFTASVYFNVLRSNAVQTAKTIKKSRYVNINTDTHSAGANGPWSLGVADVFKIEAVYLGSTAGVTTSDQDVTSHFVLDNGQKDDMYDIAKLVKKSTSQLTVSNKGILVKFSFFERDTSQGIGFLSVDSYPVNDSVESATTIKTFEIPKYTSPTTGKSYELRDSIDFRPMKANTCDPTTTATVAGSPTNPGAEKASPNTFVVDASGAYMVAPDENFQADVQQYLPRKDRIVITEEGKLEAIKGIPAATPKVPEEKANAMTLGVLNIPVYPSLSSKVARDNDKGAYGVKLTLENNRRYTMKDLRGIEERLKNAEYYSSLNALEASVKNKQLFNSSGFDRFKNGFFVENFDGHNLSDSTKKGYRASIDRNKNQLRPYFKRRDILMEKDKSFTSTNVTQTGNLLTLAYTHQSFINQDKASKARNPVQELTFNWLGDMTLDPPMDNTPDITALPDIQMDFSGMFEAFEQLASATGFTGTDWGSWINTDNAQITNITTESNIDNNTGRGTISTVGTLQQEQIKQGIQTSISPANQTFNIGNYVQQVAVREFMRSRLIKFTAHGMKPSTRVYPYFDDENVDGFTTPTNSAHANTGIEGDSLVTDSAGSVHGVFRIPDTNSLKFRIGTRRFKLQDVANNQIASDLTTTSSFADYTSIPLTITQRGASMNLVVPQVKTEDVTETRTQTSRVVLSTRTVNPDPISQTFSVNEEQSSGVFITKVDLYFFRKADTLPITVQIREVDNGHPTPNVLPYASKTLFPASINASTTSATTATTFTFDSPVFLKNYKDYCITIVPAGNSDEYAVWVAQLGAKDVDTGELIDKQPGAGVLLSSANDKTYTPIQSEDLKFQLHRANFSTSQGTVYIENPDNEFFTYDNKVGTFNPEEKIRAESVLKFSNNQTVSVGHVLKTKATSGANFANGTVRSIVQNSVAGQVTVKIDAFKDFPTTASANTNNVYISGSTTHGGWAGNTVSFTANTNNGFLDFIDELNEKMTIKNSTYTGTTVAGFVRGQVSGASARVLTADNIVNNVMVPKIPVLNVANTSSTFSVRTATSGGVISTTFKDIDLEIENPFTDNTKAIHSKINESGLSAVSGSKKSLVIKGFLNTSDSKVSPVIDLSRANSYILENVINELSSNEESNEVGDALTRYFSKPVELADGQDAEDLRVYLTAYKPSGTDIKVYAQLLASSDGEPLADKDYTLMTQVTSSSIVSDTADTNDFKEFEYSLGSAATFTDNNDNQAKLNTSDSNIVTYRTSSGIVHKTYKTFAFKIVLTSVTNASVPFIKDLRAIALQV